MNLIRNAIFAGIAGNVEAHRNTTSYEIPDWAAAGLKKPSSVTCCLATITPKMISIRSARCQRET